MAEERLLQRARTRIPLFKECISCRLTKVAKDFFAYRYTTSQNKSSTRLDSTCKACSSVQDKERRSRNRDRFIAANRAYRISHADELAAKLDHKINSLKVLVPEKECTRCGAIKLAKDFYKHKSSQDGRTHECRECRKSETIRYQKANPHKVALWSATSRLRQYGLNQQQFDAMVLEQYGKCLICGTIPKRLCVDHDHATGRVRGLLCRTCNVTLGHVREDPKVLEGFVRYIMERCR